MSFALYIGLAEHNVMGSPDSFLSPRHADTIYLDMLPLPFLLSLFSYSLAFIACSSPCLSHPQNPRKCIIPVQMPQECRRKVPDLPIPGRDDDVAERKRVLNVLAQRRYRKRKREHLQELESKLKGTASPNESLDSGPKSPTMTGNENSQTSSESGRRQCFTVAPDLSKSDQNARQPASGHLIDSEGAPYRIIDGSTAAWASTVPIENPILTPAHSNPPNYAIDLGYEGAL